MFNLHLGTFGPWQLALGHAWCLPSALWYLARTDGAGLSPPTMDPYACGVSLVCGVHFIHLISKYPYMVAPPGVGRGMDMDMEAESYVSLKGLVAKIVLVKLPFATQVA